MTVVGAFEAKTHFAQLLSRLEAGEDRIVIQRHGRNVAVLMPYREEAGGGGTGRQRRILDGLARIRESSKTGSGKATLRDLVNEGRRV